MDDRIIFDLPTTVASNFSSALKTVLVEATTASWEFWFGLLEVFEAREGDCRAAAKHMEDGYKLGSWIKKQRPRKTSLSPERIKRLDALGFSWDPLIEQWEEGFTKIRQFQKREGHCLVQALHKEDYFNLGLWIRNLRQKKGKISPKNISRLDALGFVWDVRLAQWEEGFIRLQKFYHREGHCDVKIGHKEGGYELGTWYDKQRQRKDRIPPDRIKRLDALGFVWDHFEKRWEEGLKKLGKFYKREGHCLVKKGHLEDDFKLNTWVQSQRSKRDKLPPDQVKRLDALGFVWSVRLAQWEEGFSNLQKFHDREGHCWIRAKHKEDDFGLGMWVCSQRERKDKLSKEQIKKLDALGFVWDPIGEEWEESFGKLKQFYEREGHCLVNSGHLEDDFKLSIWVSRQRHKKDKLSKDRIKKLDLLGFVWDSSKTKPASKK